MIELDTFTLFNSSKASFNYFTIFLIYLFSAIIAAKIVNLRLTSSSPLPGRVETAKNSELEEKFPINYLTSTLFVLWRTIRRITFLYRGILPV